MARRHGDALTVLYFQMQSVNDLALVVDRIVRGSGFAQLPTGLLCSVDIGDCPDAKIHQPRLVCDWVRSLAGCYSQQYYFPRYHLRVVTARLEQGKGAYEAKITVSIHIDQEPHYPRKGRAARQNCQEVAERLVGQTLAVGYA